MMDGDDGVTFPSFPCVANLALFHTCYSSANLLFTRSYLPDSQRNRRRHRCEIHKLLYLWLCYLSPGKKKKPLSLLELPEDKLVVSAINPESQKKQQQKVKL